MIETDQIYHAIFDDIACINILNILEKNGILEKLISASIDPEANPVPLPPPVSAILLRANVLSSDMHLSEEFLNLIQIKREEIFSKISFTLLSYLDFLEQGERMLWRPEEFMANSRIFSKFDYAAGFDKSKLAFESTKTWCDYVSALSSDETEVILKIMEKTQSINKGCSILELGGNKGVFGIGFEKVFSPREYTIIDIPQVTAIGRNYIKKHNSDSIIKFVSGDMFKLDWLETLTHQPDIIIFKSVLHDWPLSRVRQLIEKSLSIISDTGMILIAERCEFSRENIRSPHSSDISNLVFSPFYRDPDIYIEEFLQLKDHAFTFQCDTFEIDMRWFVLSVKLR